MTSLPTPHQRATSMKKAAPAVSHPLTPLAASLPLLLASFTALSPACQTCQKLPVTPVFVTYLVDVSKSFAPLTPEDGRALTTLTDRIVDRAVDSWEPPIAFYWTTTTRFSSNLPEPCGPPVQFRPTLIQRTNEIRNPDTLRTWHRACVLRLTTPNLPLENFSDISGAIRAVVASTTQVRGLKLLIIFSDFDEQLPPGVIPPAALDLTGYRVILLHRRSSTDNRNPPALFDRVDHWQRTLTAAGADFVCALPATGLSPAAVDACLTGF